MYNIVGALVAGGGGTWTSDGGDGSGIYDFTDDPNQTFHYEADFSGDNTDLDQDYHENEASFMQAGLALLGQNVNENLLISAFAAGSQFDVNDATKLLGTFLYGGAEGTDVNSLLFRVGPP